MGVRKDPEHLPFFSLAWEIPRLARPCAADRALARTSDAVLNASTDLEPVGTWADKFRRMLAIRHAQQIEAENDVKVIRRMTGCSADKALAQWAGH